MSKSITIISTRIWEEGSLFDDEKIEAIDNEDVNAVLDSVFGENNWATNCFEDDELKVLFNEIIKPNFSYLTTYRLKNEKDARNRALTIPALKEVLSKNEKYQVMQRQRGLFHVKGTDVYGIHALERSMDSQKWIPALLDMAQILAGDEKDLTINLFLHDKDITDEKYHVEFISAPSSELLPKDYSIGSLGIKYLTVVFFKHMVNPITHFIYHPDFDNIQKNIDDIKKSAAALSAMIEDANKLD